MRMHRTRLGCALSETFSHVRTMRSEMSEDYGNRAENIGNFLLKTLYTSFMPLVFCDIYLSSEFSEDDRGWHWRPVTDETYL